MRLVDSGQLTAQPGEPSLPVLLCRARKEHLTGALQLFTGPSVHQVFFRGGYPVCALLTGGGERLGQVLFEVGALDRDRYLRAQALTQQGQERIGAVLMQARLLDRAALREGLRAQVRRRLHRLFFLGDVDYQLFRGDHAQGMEEGEALRCDPTRAIYFGVQRAWPEHRLGTELTPTSGLAIRLQAPWGSEAARWLLPPEARVCELLGRGAWTLPELREVSGLPSRALLSLIYAFYVAGALELRPTAAGRPRRVVARPAQVVELPLRPADEPLPAAQLPFRADERPVQLHAGEAPPRLAGRRDRPVDIVPLTDD